ncbi:TetR family transcriptional regulator [Rhizobium sp. 007]|uniref:TetR/AcrR family transcriptional regulator n=1 Tax=Rhizobium sp. 007 TaxID=2785056 RepID=UPI0032B12C9A
MAEEYFRRIGHQKTSVADIAPCLGMSSATIYRFFPSRAAINRSICGHRANYPVGGCSRSARGAGSREARKSF